MAVALESKDQEDEHSCFSDNTDADVNNDLKGIEMAYTGDVPGAAAGTSLQALVSEVDPDLARTLGTELAATLKKAQAFPATFERMIAAPSGSRDNKALADTISAIEAQGDLLAKAAKALDVKVNFEG